MSFALRVQGQERRLAMSAVVEQTPGLPQVFASTIRGVWKLKIVVAAIVTLLFLQGVIGVFLNTADAQTPTPTTPSAVSDLPILGIAQVTNKVSDLDKARAYYGGVLGFEEAFDLKDAEGKVTSAYFKVN